MPATEDWCYLVILGLWLGLIAWGLVLYAL